MQRLIQEDAEETARWQADNPDLAQQNSSNLPDYCHSARSSPAESEHNGDSSSEYEMSPVLPLRSPTRESQPVFPSVHESTASNQDVAPLRSSFELPDCPTSSPMPNFSDFAKSPVPPPQSSFDDVQPAQEPQPLEEKEGEMLEPPTTSTPLQAEDPPLPVENSPEPSNIGFNSQAQDPSPAASPQPKPASRRPPKLTREAIQERMRRKHLGLDPSASPEPSTPPPPDAQTEQAHHVEETHRDVQSPLEKLGADLNPALPVDTDGMPSSGSESSLAFRAPPSPTPSKQDHESGILAARRRAKERKGERPVKHRRSMSTGDADLSSSRNVSLRTDLASVLTELPDLQSRTDEEPDTAIRLQSSRTPEEDDMRDFKPMAATPAAELPSFGHSASFGRQLHLQMQQAYENSDASRLPCSLLTRR